jgi:hypothetical protein
MCCRRSLLLHVADAGLVVAGPCPIRRTGARPESPIERKGVQPFVKHELASPHRGKRSADWHCRAGPGGALHRSGGTPVRGPRTSALALVAERRNETAAAAQGFPTSWQSAFAQNAVIASASAARGSSQPKAWVRDARQRPSSFLSFAAD